MLDLLLNMHTKNIFVIQVVDSIELRLKVIKLKLMHFITKDFSSDAVKLICARGRIKFKPIHVCIQSYAVSFILSVIDYWKKLPVAMLNFDDTKAFENSVLEVRDLKVVYVTI